MLTSSSTAPPVGGTVSLTAQVYIPPGKPYLLGELTLAEGWPKRVQAIEVDTLGAALGDEAANLFPHLVRIDAGEPGALSVDWQVVNVSPAKHIGYAVQWFLMSAVLAVIYVFRSSNLRVWLRARRQRERT